MEQNIVNILSFLPIPIIPMLPPVVLYPISLSHSLRRRPCLCLDIHPVSMSESETRISNGDNIILTGRSYHNPSIVVAASAAVAAPTTTSAASYDMDQTPSKNPVDQSGEVQNCCPRYGTTVRCCCRRCILINTAVSGAIWRYRTRNVSDRVD